MTIDAISVDGFPAGISSPNSFHIAGGVARISGNQINLRVEAGGEIGSIVAVADRAGNPPALDGNFTAKRFGRIRVGEEGRANFNLTSTAPAWRLDGQPAFDLIEVPNADALDQSLHVAPGARLGEIVVQGKRLDYSDSNGLDLGNGIRIEPVLEGFHSQIYVIPASWQNFNQPSDVNNDGLVTPLDALIVVSDLLDRGARILSRPSIKTALPPMFVDANGDGIVSPLDVLIIVNFLNRNRAEGEPHEGNDRFAPAPICWPARKDSRDAGIGPRESRQPDPPRLKHATQAAPQYGYPTVRSPHPTSFAILDDGESEADDFEVSLEAILDVISEDISAAAAT